MHAPNQDASHVSNDESAHMDDVELAAEAALDNTEIALDDTEIASASVKTKLSKTAGWLLSPKVLIGLLLVGFIVYVIIDSATTQYIRSGVTSFLAWVGNNPVAGFFVFVIVYFAATVIFIPGSILTLGAGFVFSNSFGLGLGVVLGALSVFLGASLGAVAAFILGRYLLREQVKKLSSKYAIFEALDLALQEKGLKIFILLRLSPIIPFNAINYIGGVSSVSLRDYVIALFAILPGTTLYVFLGASAGSLADSANSGENPTVIIIVVVVGVVFGILAIWLTSRYARQELNRILEKRRAEAESDQGEEEDVEMVTANVSSTETGEG